MLICEASRAPFSAQEPLLLAWPSPLSIAAGWQGRLLLLPLLLKRCSAVTVGLKKQIAPCWNFPTGATGAGGAGAGGVGAGGAGVGGSGSAGKAS